MARSVRDGRCAHFLLAAALVLGPVAAQSSFSAMVDFYNYAEDTSVTIALGADANVRGAVTTDGLCGLTCAGEYGHIKRLEPDGV